MTLLEQLNYKAFVNGANWVWWATCTNTVFGSEQLHRQITKLIPVRNSLLSCFQNVSVPHFSYRSWKITHCAALWGMHSQNRATVLHFLQLSIVALRVTQIHILCNLKAEGGTGACRGRTGCLALTDRRWLDLFMDVVLKSTNLVFVKWFSLHQEWCSALKCYSNYWNVCKAALV